MTTDNDNKLIRDLKSLVKAQNATKRSNEDKIESLQADIKFAEENITFLKDKKKLLEAQNREYEKAIRIFPGFSSEGLIGAVADNYPYQKAEFLQRIAAMREKK